MYAHAATSATIYSTTIHQVIANSFCAHGSAAKYWAVEVMYVSSHDAGKATIDTIEGTISAVMPTMNVNSMASGTSGTIRIFAGIATFDTTPNAGTMIGIVTTCAATV